MKISYADKHTFGGSLILLNGFFLLAALKSTLCKMDLGGSEDDDVLDVPPGEARAHLQHEGHHSSRQGRRGRCAGVALSAAGPPLHRPIRGNLWQQADFQMGCTKHECGKEN